MLLVVSLPPHFTSSIPRPALLSPSSLETAVDAGAKEGRERGREYPRPSSRHAATVRTKASQSLLQSRRTKVELSREISGEIGWWKNASTASFPSPDLGFRRNQSCRAEVSGLGIFRGEKAVANADPVRRGSTGRIFSSILVEVYCSIPTTSCYILQAPKRHFTFPSL